MNVTVSKTDYILYRECKKNAWYKIHKPKIYAAQELSEFEKQIIETGNEVELVARQLFPGGVLLEGRGVKAQAKTQRYLAAKTEVLFQPIFLKNKFIAAVDILHYHPVTGAYDIYEVKSTTDVDKKTHYHDVAFQVNLLRICGLKVRRSYLIHLNSEYIRVGDLNLHKLFAIEDITETVENIKEAVMTDMEQALQYLSQHEEPLGYCECVYKGRSNHCSTFAYSNPKVPTYGVHDISRIGVSKGKLQDLIDVGIFELKDVPESTQLSLSQKNQIIAYVQDKILQDKVNIKKELDTFIFPLYFLDYETFPCAIPRFDGFSPYQQMPFQYSLYILESLGAELKHFEFLFSKTSDPSFDFAASLKRNIGNQGTIIVWNKGFECKINNEMAKRTPAQKPWIDVVNARVYDLMDVFSKQYYVHKDFKGRVSIKNVLPVLVPELSYKDLEIQEGGVASQKWNEMNQADVTPPIKEKIIKDLKTYCALDTYAMYAIWKHLYGLVN